MKKKRIKKHKLRKLFDLRDERNGYRQPEHEARPVLREPTQLRSDLLGAHAMKASRICSSIVLILFQSRYYRPSLNGVGESLRRVLPNGSSTKG